jgi:hypothetical protein
LGIIIKKQPIFVAVPDDWRIHIKTCLRDEGYLIEMAQGRGDIIRLLNPPQWGGFIVVAEWALDGPDSTSLIERVRGMMPTLTIVTREAVERFGWGLIMDKVYLSPMHQFCTAPFRAEELIGRFRRAMEAFTAAGDKWNT